VGGYGVVTQTPFEGWWIDGIELASLGTLIDPHDGWDDTPPVRGENQALLGYDGVDWREKLYDAGRKTIPMGIHGAVWDGYMWLVPATGSAQRALYERNLDALLRLTGRRNRPLMVERVYPDGSRRRARCEVTAPITPATTGNAFGQIQIELIVLPGVWEDSEDLSIRVPYDIGTGGAQSFELDFLRGQTAACGDVEVSIHGACTSVSVVDDETGRGFTYAGGLSGVQTLVIQPDGRFAAERDSVSVITDVTFTGATLLRVSPAPREQEGPSVTVTAVSPGAGFDVSFSGRRKWVR
jgi:hypothetical protein